MKIVKTTDIKNTKDTIDVNETKEKIDSLIKTVMSLHNFITENCPDVRARSIARTRLDECAMWANQALYLPLKKEDGKDDGKQH